MSHWPGDSSGVDRWSSSPEALSQEVRGRSEVGEREQSKNPQAGAGQSPVGWGGTGASDRGPLGEGLRC